MTLTNTVPTTELVGVVGIGLSPPVPWFGLAPGTGFALVALLLTTGYLTILKADPRSHGFLENALIGMSMPLLVVFTAIVFWKSLLALGVV